jgi:hypothetical protein
MTGRTIRTHHTTVLGAACGADVRKRGLCPGFRLK